MCFKLGKDRRVHTGWAFVAFLLIGLGAGILYERPDAGVLIGLGLGFLAIFLLRLLYPKQTK